MRYGNKLSYETTATIGGIIVMMIPILLYVAWCELCLYTVQFTNGDTHVVRAEDIECLTKDEIVFKSLFFSRTVRGNDYRISEPLLDSFKTLNLENNEHY